MMIAKNVMILMNKKQHVVVMPSGQSCTASTDNIKEKENPTITNGKILQKGARVAYKLFDDDQEQEATIIECAGHATGSTLKKKINHLKV